MNLDGIRKQLKKDVDEILDNQVLEAVRKVEAEAIKKEVYSVYKPRIFKAI